MRNYDEPSRRKTLAALAIAAAMFAATMPCFAAVTLPEAAGDTVTIRGTVRRLSDRAPIAGATLSLGSLPDTPVLTRTDAKGEYAFGGLARTGTELVAEADGFAIVSHGVAAPVGAESVVDFYLDDGFDIPVRVADAEGKPIAGAFLQNGEYRRNTPRDRTDANGEGVLKGQPRNSPLEVGAMAEGFEFERKKVPVPGKGQTAKRVEFVLKRRTDAPTPGKPAGASPGVFAGTVKDESGRPIEGAWIGYNGANGVGDNEKVRTDPEGRYRLAPEYLIEGGSLSARADGWAIAAFTNVAPGPAENPARLDFVLNRGRTITITVVDEKDKPVEGVLIQFSSLFSHAPSSRDQNFPRAQIRVEAKTNTSGVFVFQHFPNSEAFADFHSDAYYFEGNVKLGIADQKRIVLRAYDKIRGRVIDAATQKPIERYKLFNTIGGEHFTFIWEIKRRPLEHPNGEFEMRAPGKGEQVSLQVEAEGYSLPVAVKVDPDSPDGRKPIEFALHKAAYVSGQLIAAADGRPIANARILHVPEDRRVPVQDTPHGAPSANAMERVPGYREMVTGADGAFRFAESEPKGVLYIDAAGHPPIAVEPAERARFEVGGDGTLSIALAPQATISGIVYSGGALVGGAEVYIGTPKPPGFLPQRVMAATDSLGAYSFDRLPAGTYTLGVQVDARNMSQDVTVAAGEMKIVNFGKAEAANVANRPGN